MINLKKSSLLSGIGRHHASETHVRIHVSEISITDSDDFFDKFHGEMLAIVLKGEVIAKTENEEIVLCEGDEVLIINSEPFVIINTGKFDKSIVQMCWLPGPYPCETCFEMNK